MYKRNSYHFDDLNKNSITKESPSEGTEIDSSAATNTSSSTADVDWVAERDATNKSTPVKPVIAQKAPTNEVSYGDGIHSGVFSGSISASQQSSPTAKISSLNTHV
jgi:hypothetical protein